MHDAQVFVHSSLYSSVTEKEFLPNKILIVD